MDKIFISTLSRKIILLWSALLTLGISSCTDDIGYHQTDWNETYDADEVLMPVTLSVAPIEPGDPQTREWSYEEATPEEKTIANLWIIEYNEDGNRVGLPHYYELGNNPDDQIDIEMNLEDLELKVLRPREDDHKYTVVVIANTHNGNLFNADNRSKFSTLDSLRNTDIIIHNQEDLFCPNPDEEDSNHELKYLLMSGWTKIDKDTKDFKVDLIRNTCKVNVKLTSFDYSKLAFKYYQWVDVPMGKLFPHGTTDKYTERLSLDFRMHNEVDRFEELQSEEGITFWLPCNVWLPEEDLMDGSSDTRSSKRETEDVIVNEDPTHFDIVCRNGKDEDDLNLYEFRIFPSRDGGKQFKFEPNHYYHIEVAINGIPAEENDFFRKKIFKDLGVANSYILKQDTKGTYTIGFDRPNTFWGKFGADYMIEDGTQWVAEVIWQDTDQRVVDFAIYSIGEVTPDRSRFFGEGKTCIPFRTTGTGLGNVIIGVRPKYEGEEDLTKEELDETYAVETREYLWSWHLWITDYQPDEIGDSGTSGGNGFYKVPGGQVIDMGINKMMDRNLGAWASEVKDPSKPEDIINTFGLYYQYGRKDPFPYFNPERRPVYDIDGHLIPAFNETQVTFPVTTRVPVVDENGRDVKDENGNSTYYYEEENRTETITMKAAPGGSFTYGVMRPYMFWADENETYHWASDVGEVELVGGWYMTAWYRDLMTELSKENGSNWDMKDIFDPCPPGWVMDSATADFYEGANGSVGSATELFYGQDQYLLWKGTINSDDDDQSVKFEDTEENWAKIGEYRKLEKEFWEDLNGESVSTSGAPSALMGSYLYYRDKPGTSYFPAAGSRNKYGGGDRFHNYMCLPWGNNMLRITSLGFNLLEYGSEDRKKFDEEFSTATAMQVRCVRL